MSVENLILVQFLVVLCVVFALSFRTRRSGVSPVPFLITGIVVNLLVSLLFLFVWRVVGDGSDDVTGSDPAATSTTRDVGEGHDG